MGVVCRADLDAGERRGTTVPAILEYIPYRRTICTRGATPWRSRSSRGHGYACVRVDLRGAGESEGVLFATSICSRSSTTVGTRLPGSLPSRGVTQRWHDRHLVGRFNACRLPPFSRPPSRRLSRARRPTTACRRRPLHGGCLLTENLSWASIMFGRNTCRRTRGWSRGDGRDLWRAD